MRSAACFLLALVALLALWGVASADPYRVCAEYTVTANSTVPSTTTVLETRDHADPVAGWLNIANAGSGTPSVAIQGYGPKQAGGVTNRPVALLGTLNASTTFVSASGPVFGLQAVITGCTGTCDLRIALCGLGPSH